MEGGREVLSLGDAGGIEEKRDMCESKEGGRKGLGVIGAGVIGAEITGTGASGTFGASGGTGTETVGGRGSHSSAAAASRVVESTDNGGEGAKSEEPEAGEEVIVMSN
jgi:hypothetical protein